MSTMHRTKTLNISKQEVWSAFLAVKKNRGGPGCDGQTIDDVLDGMSANLYKIWNRMSSGSYFPPPVLAVAIPKADGGQRILGIPTVGDRISQTVVKARLESILEPIFDNDSYGYRPQRSAHQALRATQQRCWRSGYVVEYDIEKFFDTMDHGLLMKALHHHVTDRVILLYVQRWLSAPMQMPDGSLIARTRGVPQGGVISPLLANLFLHYVFDVWMRKRFSRLKFCRYSDDGLIHCDTAQEASEVLEALKVRFRQCRLTLSESKTQIVQCLQNGRRLNPYGYPIQFSFLGFQFRPRRIRVKKATYFTGFSPGVSPKAMKNMKSVVKGWRLSCRSHISLEMLSKKLSPQIRGWISYYGIFGMSSFSWLACYINYRLLQWAVRKFNQKFRHKRALASVWLEKIARKQPHLFPHWERGMFVMFG
jgi:RNA-directed DNA polymerase